MSNNMGTQSASVYWAGYEIHSCLKIGATKISCVLDKGYNSFQELFVLKIQKLCTFGYLKQMMSSAPVLHFLMQTVQVLS